MAHTRSIPLAAPGLLLGAYPERPARVADRLSALAVQWSAVLALPQRLGANRMQAFIAAVARSEPHYAGLGRTALRERALALQAELSLHGLSEPLQVRAFALIRAVAVRELGVRPFDTQLVAARIMLDNRLAEMATGEGKTLAAAVCAAAAALAGIPVHVVTVNDYLVARDAQALEPLYAALGLRVGYVTAAHAAPARRAAYGCEITYCTAKELVFDYLRDRSASGPRLSGVQDHAARLDPGARGRPATLLRGLCMAVIDEADSVLIDEARVPLILSRSVANAGERDYHARALELARLLQPGLDCVLDLPPRSARLLAGGIQRLEALCADLPSIWHNRLHREETVCTALAALHLYRRDRDYLVHDGRVVIVDETTGRLAPGRVWSRGLHQLIELKEACQPSSEQVTAAQITYQRFFARYLRLGGMSGTLREARAELASVYGLDVVQVALQRPSRRAVWPTALVADRAAQWRAVTAQVLELRRAGRPVLIGTDSVADSERLSQALHQAGVEHQVLNARHDLLEASIVAGAGAAGCVTVATNMAGRGTDIALGPGVAERGGLHVICCQHNSARRIDRQLIGRCARQGDPGSAQTLLALDNALMAGFVPRGLARRLVRATLARPRWWIQLLVRLPQWLQERRERAQRHLLQRQDEHVERHLLVGVRGD